MSKTWWHPLLWLIVLALLGFTIPALFAGWLQLPRRIFLIPYLLFSCIFIIQYFRKNTFPIAELIQRNWIRGLIMAILAGLFVVMNVLSQPESQRSSGALLAFDVVWLGIIYGLADALLLSVIPVLAIWQSSIQLGWTTTWSGRITTGLLALLASLIVTGIYHWGYPEFQNVQVKSPMIGNGVCTLVYLLSHNPFSAILSHIAMHIAGVLNGPESVLQLPPHY